MSKAYQKLPVLNRLERQSFRLRDGVTALVRPEGCDAACS